MHTRNKPAIRWPLLVGYLGTVIVLIACGMIGRQATQASTAQGTLRLDNGVVEIRADNGDWTPVGGEATFELVGKLESTNPWKVAGSTIATRSSTQIAAGLKVGDLVRVKGLILKDATWLATSIEPAEQQTDPTIILIGKVTSIDPLVVNGIKLNVTGDTVISKDITPGMLVRVEILLSPDGTWEVISITPLSDLPAVPGCLTVTAQIVSINGNEIQLVGWPTITLGADVDIENDQGGKGKLEANQSVLVVVCATENGEITITKIIILNVDNEDTSEGGKKVLICHKPDKKGGHTLSIASSAVPAHLAHGDKLGPCP
ncbi:MAG TPA: DUF5666 domain-containing protein [Anaerolineales bacterium]|nr:DUF5666 domain-containing protein [Anaerolineales bacterium]